MNDSRGTEQLERQEALKEGWNMVFRKIPPEQILKGVQLNLIYRGIPITMITVPEPETIATIRKGGPMETGRINLVVDAMPVRGTSFTVHIQTPDQVTHRGIPKRSRDGNVQSFSEWQDATALNEGHVRYALQSRRLSVTALELQNSGVAVNPTAELLRRHVPIAGNSR